MKKYICYDGVENEVAYFDTEKEAIEDLKKCIEASIDDGEYYISIEDSFVAQIIYKVIEKEIEAPECYKKEGISKLINMEIEEVKGD